MNFQMDPVSIMGAPRLAYIYMHKEVALVTRKFYFYLLSVKLIPPASNYRHASTLSLDNFCLFSLSKIIMNAISMNHRLLSMKEK